MAFDVLRGMEKVYCFEVYTCNKACRQRKYYIKFAIASQLHMEYHKRTFAAGVVGHRTINAHRSSDAILAS
jgi:hypothetical protein